MTRSFIRQNAACQTGKGTDWARKQVKLMMEREYRQHGADGYVLLVDIRHYYDTMPHDVANRCFERHLPPSVHNRVREVLDRQYTGEAGYNPGSQMVQLAGISVPDPIDHYIKERLRAKKYVRLWMIASSSTTTRHGLRSGGRRSAPGKIIASPFMTFVP